MYNWSKGTPKHLEDYINQFLQRLNVTLSSASYKDMMTTAKSGFSELTYKMTVELKSRCSG